DAGPPAEGANRGEGGAKGLARRGNAAQQQPLIALHAKIGEWIPTGAEHQVYVSIDQTWHERRLRQVDDLGLGGCIARWLDADNAAVFHLHRLSAPNRRSTSVAESSPPGHFPIGHRPSSQPAQSTPTP